MREQTGMSLDANSSFDNGTGRMGPDLREVFAAEAAEDQKLFSQPSQRHPGLSPMSVTNPEGTQRLSQAASALDHGDLQGFEDALPRAEWGKNAGDIARLFKERGIIPEGMSEEEVAKALASAPSNITDPNEVPPAPTHLTEEEEKQGHMPMPAVMEEGNKILSESKEILENYDKDKEGSEKKVEEMRGRIADWLPKAGKFLNYALVIAIVLAIILLNRSFAIAGGKGGKIS